MKQTALDYFAAHPSARNDVLKAYHAWHVVHFTDHAQAHNFTNGSRDAKCVWCQRTRHNVRWDELSAECLHRPQLDDTHTIIQQEEAKAHAIYQRARREVPALVAKHGALTGALLATLHHTYGFDPETVASVIDVPQVAMDDYHVAMEKQRELSRNAYKPQIIALT